MTLEVRHREVGPWSMNTYALVCSRTGESVLFDPGADPDVLEAMLAGSRPRAIVLTHTHADHVGALDEMRRRLGVPLLAHPGPHAGDLTLDGARHIAHGERIPVGASQLIAHYAPGHIDDHIAFNIDGENNAIVGDVIFDGGPGRTWTSAGFRQTLQTLREVVLPWPDDTICYPGHGPRFRLGDRRAAIEAFLVQDHGDFYGDATWDMTAA